MPSNGVVARANGGRGLGGARGRQLPSPHGHSRARARAASTKPHGRVRAGRGRIWLDIGQTQVWEWPACTMPGLGPAGANHQGGAVVNNKGHMERPAGGAAGVEPDRGTRTAQGADVARVAAVGTTCGCPWTGLPRQGAAYGCIPTRGRGLDAKASSVGRVRGLPGSPHQTRGQLPKRFKSRTASAAAGCAARCGGPYRPKRAAGKGAPKGVLA